YCDDNYNDNLFDTQFNMGEYEVVVVPDNGPPLIESPLPREKEKIDQPTSSKRRRINQMDDDELLDELDELVGEQHPSQFGASERNETNKSPTVVKRTKNSDKTFNWSDYCYKAPEASRPVRDTTMTEKNIRNQWIDSLKEQRELIMIQKDFFRESLVMIRRTIEMVEKSSENMERIAKAVISALDREGVNVKEGRDGGRDSDYVFIASC
ncbi:hypothetical protein PFISCL1PPCAC_29186, partial [Pristionchus fissidentatus]